MATTTKTFLDYNGLEKLWTKISNGFSPRWLAIDQVILRL